MGVIQAFPPNARISGRARIYLGVLVTLYLYQGWLFSCPQQGEYKIKQKHCCPFVLSSTSQQDINYVLLYYKSCCITNHVAWTGQWAGLNLRKTIFLVPDVKFYGVGSSRERSSSKRRRAVRHVSTGCRQGTVTQVNHSYFHPIYPISQVFWLAPCLHVLMGIYI